MQVPQNRKISDNIYNKHKKREYIMKKNRLLVGVGRTDITPELGVRLGGYGQKDRPAEKINDPLHSTTLYLMQNEEEAAFINLDWLAVEFSEVSLIKNAVNKKTKIPKDNIVVSTTHTHTAPNTLNFNGWGKVESEYVNSVLATIVDSVATAKNTAEQATTGVTDTRSKTGINRRFVALNNSTEMRGDEYKLYDPFMTIVRFENDKGKPITTLIHYGAHATAWGDRPVVSRDWPGVMKDRIESQTKAPVVFINGAIGNVGPRTNCMIVDNKHDVGFSAGTGDGIDSVREVGYRAATDALHAYASIKTWNKNPELAIITKDIILPFQKLPSLETAKKEIIAAYPNKDNWGVDMCKFMYWEDVVNTLESKNIKTKTAFRQTIITIDDIAIIPFPGELFAEISLRLRHASPFRYTLCASVTNGSYAYLPAREARHRGGYEVWIPRGYGAHILDENIDDVLVKENLQLLVDVKLK